LQVLCLSLIHAETGIASPVVYDLVADWSDERNPNGVWTYTGNNGVVLTTSLKEWDPRGFMFSGQRAWANAVLPKLNHVPMWFKATEPSIIDVPGVGVHGSEGSTDAWVGLTWRSPVNATISISGGVWQAWKSEAGVFGGNHRNRNSDWRLRMNNTVLASGNVSGTDAYSSSSPFALVDGASSRSLNNISVSMGDVVVLEFISPTSYATFVGVDLVITATQE